MKSPLLYRLAGLPLGLYLGGLVMQKPMAPWGIFIATCWLLLFYTFVRPLLQTVVLPFSVLLFGLPMIAADALLVWWAGAWAPDVHLTYPACLVIALFISVLHIPYGHQRRAALNKKSAGEK